MINFEKTFAATLLTLCIAAASHGGTISGSRTDATSSRVGTITGSRTGTITGSRTGTISGSRTGTITGSSTGNLPVYNDHFGNNVDALENLISRIMVLLVTLSW